MNDLYWMITITDRHSTDRFTDFYEKYGASVSFVSVGRGTAASEVLDFLGLDITEKSVIFSTVTHKVWKAIRHHLRRGAQAPPGRDGLHRHQPVYGQSHPCAGVRTERP